MSETWNTYVCTYRFEGKEYGFDVVAQSWEEAEARIKVMGLGRVDGVLQERIPVNPITVHPIGLWVRFTCWIGNRFKLQ